MQPYEVLNAEPRDVPVATHTLVRYNANNCFIVGNNTLLSNPAKPNDDIKEASSSSSTAADTNDSSSSTVANASGATTNNAAKSSDESIIDSNYVAHTFTKVFLGGGASYAVGAIFD